MRLKKGVGWKGKPCAGGETSSTLEDSDRGMLRRDKETLGLQVHWGVWMFC